MIKAIFLQLEKKWEKIKSQRLQMGEKYLVRKSCDSPLSSITVHMEELQMPIEKHSYCRKRVKGSETHALVQFVLECLLCGRHNVGGGHHLCTFLNLHGPSQAIVISSEEDDKIEFYLEKSTLESWLQKEFQWRSVFKEPRWEIVIVKRVTGFEGRIRGKSWRLTGPAELSRGSDGWVKREASQRCWASHVIIGLLEEPPKETVNLEQKWHDTGVPCHTCYV